MKRVKSVKPLKESYLQTQFVKTFDPYVSLSTGASTPKPFFIQFRPELSKSV